METSGYEYVAASMRIWWSNHKIALIRFAIVIMTIATVVWLSYQFWRLLSPSPPIWSTSPPGAVDLIQRHNEVTHWYAFPKLRTYYTVGTAVYPPASYITLWPLLGWLGRTPARWFWAFTTILNLGWLASILVRESGAETRLERTFVALIPLSIYATGATIGNGQLNVHIMPLLLTSILMLSRQPPGWDRDLKSAGMFVMALTKPTIAGPFFWAVMFVRRPLRPAALVVSVYIILTIFVASFKDMPLQRVLLTWVMRASGAAAHGATTGAVANQYTWLISLGLNTWLIPAALLGVLAMGVWMYAHRRVDPWILLGVIGILTRLGFYHRWYDDMLILPAMIALYRLAKQGPPTGGRDVIAGGLFAILLMMMMAPGGLYLLPAPWDIVSVYVQTGAWIGVLFFLFQQAWHERHTVTHM